MNYFDYNATTPVHPGAREAWLEAVESAWQNPAAYYRAGARVRALLNEARERLAATFNGDPEELVFLSGATEACNLWVDSLVRHQGTGKTPLVLASAQEHPCLVASLEAFAPGRVIWFSPHEADVVDRIESELARHPTIKAVVMMAANNETGLLFPWEAVAERCRERGLAYFCDASQWAGKLRPDGWEKLDYFCASAHKFGGPKGVGFLKTSRRFPPLRGLRGGDQEQGIRSGTPDYPAVQAMVRAWETTQAYLSDAEAVTHRLKWQQDFRARLESVIPDACIHGREREHLWNTVNVSLPIASATDWIEALDRRGFAVASGAACATGKASVSHVLRDMGVSESLARRAIRISSGWETRASDWEALAEAIIATYRELSDPPGGGLTEVISIDSL